MSEAAQRFQSFREFYPYYLAEHSNLTCRRLHYAGTTGVLVLALFAPLAGQSVWLWALPAVGYGPAWAGHFFFERNRPATFKYPFYSLAGDFLMYWQMLTGRIKF
jgi:hypothetical protein